MKYVYYFCFFIIIKVSFATHGKHNGKGLTPSIPPTVFGETKFTTRKNKALATWSRFCKSTYSPKEAEELLDFGKYYTLLILTT